MTEGSTETTTGAVTDELGAIPKDNPNGTGYAVYDTQLLRYVGGVTTDKPSSSDARKLAPNGHRIIKV